MMDSPQRPNKEGEPRALQGQRLGWGCVKLSPVHTVPGGVSVLPVRSRRLRCREQARRVVAAARLCGPGLGAAAPSPSLPSWELGGGWARTASRRPVASTLRFSFQQGAGFNELKGKSISLSSFAEIIKLMRLFPVGKNRLLGKHCAVKAVCTGRAERPNLCRQAEVKGVCLRAHRCPAPPSLPGPCCPLPTAPGCSRASPQ